MNQKKVNKMASKVMIMAVLTTGLLIAGTHSSEASLIGAKFTKTNLGGTDSSRANSKIVKQKEGELVVRLKLKKMICTMSDDEGPGNDADMGLFNITVNGKRMYKWTGYKTTPKGYTWNVDAEMEFTSIGSFIIYGEAREIDVPGDADEWGRKTSVFDVNREKLVVGQIIPHRFTISSDDFSFDLYFEAEIMAL